MTSALVIELDCLADTRVIELVKDLNRQHNDLRRTLVIVVVTAGRTPSTPRSRTGSTPKASRRTSCSPRTRR